MARPTGVGRALATCEIPIEGRDEWVAAARRRGGFYELETTSPGAELEAGKTLVHVHRTFHFVGPKASLDTIARATLGVALP